MSAPEYKATETVTLNEPIISIAAGGVQIKEVTIRRPKAKLIKEIEAIPSGYDSSAHLIGALSSPALSPNEIAELDGNDFRRLDALVLRFFQSSRPTGDSAKSA